MMRQLQTIVLTALATLTLNGCTRTATGQSYYDPQTGIEYKVSPYNREETSLTTGDAAFNEILQRHQYVVFKRYGNAPNPVKILADVDHTISVKKRNNALLKDILTADDILFVEGYVGGIRYPDLENHLFEVIKTPESFQAVFKALADQSKGFKNTSQEESYFNQGFPSKIESSDDDVLAYVCQSLYLDIEDLSSLSPEEARTTVYGFNQTLHHRNIAITRTIKKKLQENPAVHICQVIGLQHVTTNLELKKLGHNRPTFAAPFAGELCTLLEAENISYMLIIPANFADE